jgi:DNA-binding NtrC family response regulator
MSSEASEEIPMITTTARATKTVLIVDDDQAIVRMLKEAVGLFRHQHAYKIETAGDGADALAALHRDHFDLVLLDMYMPRMTGLELLAQMRHLKLQTPVLMLTGNDDTRTAADALASGIFAYIPKPFDLQHLEHLVSLALSSRSPATS